MANRKGKPDNLDPVRTKKEATERGRNGGIKSGESRRRKKDAKEAIRLLLEMPAKNNLKANCKQFDLDDEDCTNMQAAMVRLYQKWITEGDINAFRAMMEYGGYAPDQDLKDQERRARIDAIEKSGGAGAISSGDWGEDGDGGDVIIYLPELDDKVEERRQQEAAKKETGEETNAQSES